MSIVRAVDLNSVINERTSKFNVKRQKGYSKEEYIEKAINLIRLIEKQDARSIAKLREELKEKNVEYDIQRYANDYNCTIYGDGFSTYAIPLDDESLFVCHSEQTDALEVVNMEKFKGTFVLDGAFDVISANTYDKNN
jgi:hypothetical protein